MMIDGGRLRPVVDWGQKKEKKFFQKPTEWPWFTVVIWPRKSYEAYGNDLEIFQIAYMCRSVLEERYIR